MAKVLSWYDNAWGYTCRLVELAPRLVTPGGQYPYRGDDVLRRSALWEGVRDGQWSAEELLTRIDATGVDGDSRYYMSVYAITTIER